MVEHTAIEGFSAVEPKVTAAAPPPSGYEDLLQEVDNLEDEMEAALNKFKKPKKAPKRSSVTFNGDSSGESRSGGPRKKSLLSELRDTLTAAYRTTGGGEGEDVQKQLTLLTRLSRPARTGGRQSIFQRRRASQVAPDDGGDTDASNAASRRASGRQDRRSEEEGAEPRTPRKRGMRRFSVARATEASRRGSVLFGRSSVSDGAAADGSPPPRRPSRGRRFSTALSTIFSKGPDASAEKYAAGGSGDDGESTRRSNRKSVTVTVPEETPSRAGTFTSEEAVGGEASPADGEWQPRKRAASRLSRRVSTLAGNRRMSTMPSGAPSPPGARRPRRRSVVCAEDGRRSEEEAAPASVAEEPTPEETSPGGRTSPGGSKYAEQHNDQFDSPEMRKLRRGIRWDKGVRLQVQKLWDIAETQTFRMDCTSYMDYHLSVFHWLMAQEEEEGGGGGVVDDDEAWANGVEDWNNDLQGLSCDDTATTLHFEGFFDSVFELVDLWVDSVDAKDYIAFLKQLIDEVTETVEAGSPETGSPTRRSGTEKRRWLHSWPRATAEQEAEVAAALVALRAHCKSGAKKDVARLFTAWHGDADGTLSLAELAAGARSLAPTVAEFAPFAAEPPADRPLTVALMWRCATLASGKVSALDLPTFTAAVQTATKLDGSPKAKAQRALGKAKAISAISAKRTATT